jgi:hypothetical protein
MNNLLDYNSQRDKLKIPEYGRTVQKMIEHAVTIEDRDKRNKAARSIVGVMAVLNPQLRDYTDFNHKLWDHLIIISDFKLDVDNPYPMPSPDTIIRKPQPVSYPGNQILYRHYGKIIQKVINEVVKLKDEEKQNAMITNIANFMKMSYLNYNRDSVSDELIFDQLFEISEGKLKAENGIRLNNAEDMIIQNQSSQRKPLNRQRNNRMKTQHTFRRFKKK